MITSLNLLHIVLANIALEDGKPASVRLAEGMLLLSDDPKVFKKATSEWKFHDTYSVVAERFPYSRFIVSEWGKRSVIVIDSNSGPIGELKERTEAAQFLASHAAVGKSFDINGLSQEQLQALFLAGQIPPGGTLEGSVGLGVCIYLTIYSVNNAKKTTLQVYGDSSQCVADLRSHPFVPHPNPDYKADPAKEIIDRGGKTTIRLYGYGHANFAEGLRELSKQVDKAELLLRYKLRLATEDLVKKLGFNGKHIGEGKISLSELPTEWQNQLRNNFKVSWRNNGFADDAEAETYFNRASSYQIRTSLWTQFCVNPGDGTIYHAPSMGMIRFSTLNGAVTP